MMLFLIVNYRDFSIRRPVQMKLLRFTALVFRRLTLLHSERSKLYIIFVFLSATESMLFAYSSIFISGGLIAKQKLLTLQRVCLCRQNFQRN